ncbi:class F sortase [Streptomyces sp. NPDC002917]|uniref:class F sortase n=1 Tax=unclassified Streptomyces TaxID=2593676 RepID=UPI002E823496|nr:class F sortase [Streptomyces sp. NBC_00562]WTC79820.1 class F sortase [Streptomyces sp. NBC_01653]WTD35634.1 class F sortase [Streptomyces sp. NBC_01643]WTD91043.1 class F sortase [Streptomyces sp. NBC_01637]WUC22037.1 class F sortase [Streptomyces sp. NBC_00562]
MAAPQSSDPNPSPSGTGSSTFGRSLLWPAAAAGLGLLMIFNSFGTAEDNKPLAAPSVAAPAPAAAPPAPSAAPSPVPTGLFMPRSKPTKLQIPSIAVNAPFTPLSLGAKGQLNAPPPNDTNLVGWYKGGVTPGERGSAIVAGHVDTTTGPAVFLQLQFVKQGATVDITRADGSVATFKVDSVEKFSKANFPDELVYADTPNAQLRLITCGGTYDRKAKDYKDNVVVFAHLDSTKRP